MRDSLIFYRSFYEAIRDLPRDVQGEIYTAIMEYGLYGNEIEQLKPIARSIFILIKPQLDSNNIRYENGKKGGRPKGSKNQKETEQKPNKNQKETEQKPNVNVNENVNVLDKSNSARVCVRAHEVGDLTFISGEYRDVFAKWIAYKAERKEKYKTQDSLRECYERLKALSGNNPGTAMAIVNQSMANNWAGLFELKQSKNGNSSQQDRKSFESSSEISFKRKADIEI